MANDQQQSTPAVEEAAKSSARPIKWNLYALGTVLPILFVIIIWQLYGLDPELYCHIVKDQGVPPGDHCFKLLMESMHIKGWVIWLLIGTVASFVLIVLTAAVKAVVGLVGPGGLGLNINTPNNGEQQCSDGSQA